MSQIPSQMDIVERLREKPNDGGERLSDGSYAMGCSCTWGPGERCYTCKSRMDPIRKEAADTITQLREQNDAQAFTIGQHQEACKRAGLDPCTGCANCIDTLRERLEQTTKEREEALGYEIKLRAERDQLRLSNERMREALKALKRMMPYLGSMQGRALAWGTKMLPTESAIVEVIDQALTAESGTEGKG